AVISYGSRAALVFFATCVAVGFAMENIGVATGFPFGRYHFEIGADLPNVGRIPFIVGPMWFGAGYFSWIVAATLLGEADRKLDRR
ncbi:carotenoid biosynthesis protein, partial [Acinetobacter baumannii]